jgi:hypothetical protein
MAWALVIVLAVIAAAVLAWALTIRSKLAAQRAATATAEQATAVAVERAGAAESGAASRIAEVEAIAAASARTDAAMIESLQTALDDALARAERAEGDRAIDPDVLWRLERARSERTWRFSVAVGPDSVSALRAAGADATTQALVEALRVEVDAAREEVGTIVELDADIPDGVPPAGAVITLRIAQELLADVVRRSESSTLRVSADGRDLMIAVDAEDEHGNPVVPAALPLPPSPSISVDRDGAAVRVVGAAARRDGSSRSGAASSSPRDDPAPEATVGRSRPRI